MSSAHLATGDALVRVELATICGSDVHTTRGDRSAPAPLVLGHEQVGHIVALGPTEVTAIDGAPLRVGDRVVWTIMASCGDCDRCTRGLPQKCRHIAKYGHETMVDEWQLSGGFATHVHVRRGTAIARVPEGIAADILAPVSCGTATARAALDAASAIVPLAGSTVLVTGGGLVGLAATAMATDLGARVIVADPDEARRGTAVRFGAVGTYDPRHSGDDADAADSVIEMTSIDSPTIVIEASGSPAAVASALASVGVGGVVVLVGSVFPTATVPLDPEAIVRGLLTVRGVHNYEPRHLVEAVDFVVSRSEHYPFSDLVGATVSLADLDEGIRLAGAGVAVRVGVDPR